MGISGKRKNVLPQPAVRRTTAIPSRRRTRHTHTLTLKHEQERRFIYSTRSSRQTLTVRINLVRNFSYYQPLRRRIIVDVIGLVLFKPLKIILLLRLRGRHVTRRRVTNRRRYACGVKNNVSVVFITHTIQWRILRAGGERGRRPPLSCVYS